MKLKGALLGILLGATVLFGGAKTAKAVSSISGNAYGTYNNSIFANSDVYLTFNNGSNGTLSTTVDNTGYWLLADNFNPFHAASGDTMKMNCSKTIGGKTYLTHARKICNSSDVILPTVFLDDTSKAVKAHAIGTWAVKDSSTNFTDSLKARGWLKKNLGQKINFVNYYRQSIGGDSLSIDITDPCPQVYINLEKQDSLWQPSDSAFVELYKIRNDSTFSKIVGFQLDTMKYGCATMLDTIVFNPTTGIPNGVEMSYFGAMPYGNGIKIEWQTESALDSYLWKIMRGKNNDSLNYDLIATQPGDGNSNEPKHWYYDDACARGKNWYKLVEVDFSGAETPYGPFSATAGLEGALSEGRFKVWPNPAKSLLQLKVDKAGNYSIHAITGQRVGKIRKDINGTTSSEIKENSSPAGVYFMTQEETGDTKRVILLK